MAVTRAATRSEQVTVPVTSPEAGAAPSAMQRRHDLELRRSEQRLVAGALGGSAAALVGAVAWAAVTVATGYQIGWMAVGIGVLVGFVVRSVGHGVDATFGVLGAALALFGCGLGNLLAACGMVAIELDASVLDVLGRLDVEMAIELMTVTFSPMDLLFYGIALYEGYRLALVPTPPAATATTA